MGKRDVQRFDRSKGNGRDENSVKELYSRCTVCGVLLYKAQWEADENSVL